MSADLLLNDDPTMPGLVERHLCAAGRGCAVSTDAEKASDERRRTGGQSLAASVLPRWL